MSNQIKVQMYKLRRSVVFYLIIAGLFTTCVMFSLKIINEGTDINGGRALLASISDTSLMFIPALFVSYFIGVDFLNRTIQNEVRIGYNRLSVVLTRGFAALAISVFLYLVSYTLPITIILGIANGGFDTGFSFGQVVIRLVLFCVQLMALQSFSVLFSFVSKNATLGMLISVCFTFLTCNLLRNLFDENDSLFALTSFYRIMMNSSSMMNSEILLSFISAIITIMGVLFVTHIAFRRAELK